MAMKLSLLTLSLFFSSILLCKNQEIRIALIIGNSNYSSLGKLANPTNDANDMSKILSSLGFDVVAGTNLNKKQMLEKINLFDDKINNSKAENTVAVFYYAGHGMEVNGRNFVIPTDAEMKYQEDVEFDGIVLDKIISRMERSNAKLNLVVLDACRDNPLPKKKRSSKIGGWGAINNVAEGTYIAFGTSPGRQAADSDGLGRNGLFTKHILKYLNEPGLSLNQLFKKVRKGVSLDSNQSQLTWSNDATFDDYYLVPTTKATSSDSQRTNDYHTEDSTVSMYRMKPGLKFQDCGICPEMVVLPSGSLDIIFFDDSVKSNRKKIRQFAISTTEVTMEQWNECLNDGECKHKPVEEFLLRKPKNDVTGTTP
jgi:hypothetical protein